MAPDDAPLTRDSTSRRPAMAQEPSHQRVRLLISLTVLVRLALIAILIYAVTHQGMPQFHGKGMTWRLLLYPLVTMIVPAYWLLFSRHSGEPYPFALDILVGIPPLFDSAGNALNLYDRVTWWDDFNHLINPVFIAIAFGLLLTDLPLGRFAFGIYILGIGAILGMIWNWRNISRSVRRSPEFTSAYSDTMGDLLFDLLGSLIGVAIVTLLFRRRLRKPGDAVGRCK